MTQVSEPRPASAFDDPPDPLGLRARLLHRDASVLILDKPSGLPVHKGPGGGENLTDHLNALRFGLPRDPEIGHRLDKDTSGCLVLGRHRRALQRLAELFRANAVTKTYWAVVVGRPPDAEGEVNLALAPRDKHRGWWMKVDPGGQLALTRYRVLGADDRHALLALEPVTGRTHQLRIHCASIGCAILGDAIYGDAPRRDGPGLHLLARRISLPYDPKKAPITAEAPPPPHMLDALTRLGFAG